MKRNVTTIFITLSLLFSLAGWRALSSRAASGHTGAGQQVGEPFRIPAIAAGGFHSLALKSDGTVVAWGDNVAGQTTMPAGLGGVTAIAAGRVHSLALKSDGSVVVWGGNDFGQATVPAGLSGVTAIAARGFHSLALKSDGTVVAWGRNDFGQATVPPGLSGVTAIAAGDFHSLALKSDGTVVAWGDNVSGQTTVPAGLSSVTAIAAGLLHSLALKSDGSVVAWGFNGNGQTTVPAGLSSVKAIAAGFEHNLALKSDGSVVAWGRNNFGQTTLPPAGLSGVTAIAPGGGDHGLALKSDGAVVAWGRNDSGQATVPSGLTPGSSRVLAWGSNSFGPLNVPSGLSGVTAIAGGSLHSLALKSDGSVVAWGFNGFGQTMVPTGLSGVTAIAAGRAHSLALKSDGSVVGWGFNGNGQATVPPSLSKVTAIAAGDDHSLALKSDGTVVAWGLNFDGQTTVPSGLSGVTAIAGGGLHSLALKSNGTVVAWGSNLQGKTNVPAALSGVTAIAASLIHSLALKSDGSVVAWGDNSSGQATVPPAAQSGVTAIAAGVNHSLALKSDGSVVAWGSIFGTVPAGVSRVLAIAAGFQYSLALSLVNNSAPAITALTVPLPADTQLSSYPIATVNDDLDAADTLTVSATLASGSGVTLGSITTNGSGNVTATVDATCTATTSTFTLRVTDSGGLFAEGSLTVTVTPETERPMITCPANIAKSMDPNQCSAVVTYSAPTVSDNCSGVGAPSCTPASGSTFPKGTTTVSCSVADASGNQSSCSFTVTVDDTQAPMLTCPANVTRSTDPNQCSAVVTYPAPTVSDNCSGAGAPFCTPPSGSTFAKGTATVNCNVSDASGNQASCSFSVTVNDTQPPSITCPANITVPVAIGLCSAVVTYSAPVLGDNCPNVGAPTCTPPSGSTFAKGTSTVNCSVRDAVNNQSTCGFTITVLDTQAPTIACPANIITDTVNAGDATVVVTFAAPQAADNCPGVGVACLPPSGSQFPRGTTTVLCIATDGSNNQASCSFSVKVFDYVIVDDTNGKLLRFVSSTGDYDFFDCRKGQSLSGRGIVTINSCKTELRDIGPNPRVPDRNLYAQANPCTRTGTATLTYLNVTHTLSDANLSNNPVKCQ